MIAFIPSKPKAELSKEEAIQNIVSSLSKYEDDTICKIADLLENQRKVDSLISMCKKMRII